jgi:hypothetical protein
METRMAVGTRLAIRAKGPYRLVIVAVLVALAALGFEFQQNPETPGRLTAPENDFRLPVANPPLEIDRPDLIGEPRIDE